MSYNYCIMNYDSLMFDIYIIIILFKFQNITHNELNHHYYLIYHFYIQY